MSRVKSTLAVMAAGIGSRYGKGIKQLAHVGPSGELIMDYSVHDALEAGFDKIVFIIRKDIEKEFRETIGKRMEKFADVSYVFQELDDLPKGFSLPPARRKPWGTGQAILAAAREINGPFAVINADDYYGKSAFVRLHENLCGGLPPADGKEQVSMVSFRLGNTLSDHGGVTRGICILDRENHLTGIRETRNIVKTPEGAEAPGPDGSMKKLSADLRVSMNMWGLQDSFLDILRDGFCEFLSGLEGDGSTGEYLIPDVIDRLLREDRAEVTVLSSEDRWFGVTYQEDKQNVIDEFRSLTERGIYSRDLYSDLSL